MQSSDRLEDVLVIQPWTNMWLQINNPNHRLHVERAEGCFLYTRGGFRLLDASAGLGNVSVGHGRRDVVGAIAEQLIKLTYHTNIDAQAAFSQHFANRLAGHAPKRMNRITFHSTGTAAVESALLQIRQHFKILGKPDRTRVISLESSYHGCSLLGAAVSGDREEANWLRPLPEGFFRIPAPRDQSSGEAGLECLRQLLAAHRPETFAAFIYEPIMGMAGVIVPPDWWVQAVVETCHAHGIMVVADEVLTALGRAGEWFRSASSGVDAIVVGKGIGGGYVPVSAVLYDQKLFEPYLQGARSIPYVNGSTMDGCPAACAAGSAVLDVIEREGLVERSRVLGGDLMACLRELEVLELVGPLRGAGLMIGIPLLNPARPDKWLPPTACTQLLDRLMQAGVWCFLANSTVFLAPPLVITSEECDFLVSTMKKVLGEFCHFIKGV